MTPRRIELLDWGVIEYAEALERQRRLFEALIAEKSEREVSGATEEAKRIATSEMTESPIADERGRRNGGCYEAPSVALIAENGARPERERIAATESSIADESGRRNGGCYEAPRMALIAENGEREVTGATEEAKRIATSEMTESLIADERGRRSGGVLKPCAPVRSASLPFSSEMTESPISDESGRRSCGCYKAPRVARSASRPLSSEIGLGHNAPGQNEHGQNEHGQNEPGGKAGWLVLCEHPHVYTLGRSGQAANLLVSEESLKEKGAALHRTERGGDITYHGPGQIVGYPILDLDAVGLGLREYVEALEQSVIETVAAFGIEAGRVAGKTGVWVTAGAQRKICAIGVKASRGVVMHGFALNAATDLGWFELINPCGFVGGAVTSIEKETGRNVDLEEVKRVLRDKILETLNYEL